jgi:hypothetical protein
MTNSIAVKIARMKRLPRHHRIAHLRAIIPTLPARSIRRGELETLLKAEVTAQLRKENRCVA